MPAKSESTFEESLAELNAVVRALEEGALGLEESIARFERGVALLNRCYQALERAEQRIELLTSFDRSGNPITVPFSAEATFQGAESAESKRRGGNSSSSEPTTPPRASLF